MYLQIIIKYSIIIFSASLLIPYIFYRINSSNKMAFKQWLNIFDVSILEIIFTIGCLFIILLFNTIQIIIPSLLSLYFIILFGNKIENRKILIPISKKYLSAFLFIFLLYSSILIFSNLNSLVERLQNINKIRIVQFILTFPIFLGFIFNIKLKDFNFKIRFVDIIYSVVVFVLLKVFYLYITDIDFLNNITVKYFIVNLIQHIYYPSIVEEIIFRGFLLSALLSFNIRGDKANIIQAIIFGFSHMFGYKEITLISFFMPFVQIFIGYLIGKMYLKNKSISSCILVHALIDTL